MVITIINVGNDLTRAWVEAVRAAREGENETRRLSTLTLDGQSASFSVDGEEDYLFTFNATYEEIIV